MNDLPLWKRILLWTPGNEGRGSRYGIVVGISMAVIWVPPMSYLGLAPRTYTSEWTLILPGSGSSSSVNLENIGQATSSATSPYGSNNLSPKVNYKSIAESRVVLKQAADTIELTLEEFGKPRIELIEQTALLLFSVKGGNPEQARAKSWALYKALQDQLQRLRNDEISLREQGTMKMIEEYRNKLDETRDSLLQFQASSEIAKVQAFDKQADSVRQLQGQLAQVEADRARTQGELEQLSANLGMTPAQAADALILQTDRLFQKTLQQYVEANVGADTLFSKWGPNHPEVVKERGRRDAAKSLLNQRLKTLLKGRNGELLNLLTLDQDVTRDALFQKLLNLAAENKGLAKKAEALQNIVNGLESNVSKGTQMAATLDELQRDHQIAEAVFTSALARIDTGKSDLYVSYPLVQMLSEPTVPDRPSSPHTLFVLAGCFAATFFTTIGLVLLWLRKPLLHKILLNESFGTPLSGPTESI